ncbi:preprotein translocase subunit Sec61beta [Candidatus Woesearchaeota archaeon]|nr:MAG: preprotein translocase subunit Sec61beta [Candidatus Woesearchaeota archaeon]
MARPNRIHMPSSGGGLVRYFDEYKSRVVIKPLHVIILIGIVIIIILALHARGV